MGTTTYSYTDFGALLSEDGPWADDTVTYSMACETHKEMNGVLDKKPKCTRRHAAVLLFVVAAVAVWAAALGRRDASPLLVLPNHVNKNPPLSLSPKTYSELLAIDPSRLGDCDVALVNLLCAERLPNAKGLDVQNSLAMLDGWASLVRSETLRHFYRFQRNPAEFEDSEGYFRMLMMAVVLYEDCQVRYNPERIAMLGQAAMGDGFFADSQDVFLHGLFGLRRMGTCSSMPVLYVALGRRLGYPLKLVTTKGHLFVRWESPTERFNVDATGRGVNRYDDAHYRNWPFSLSDAEIKEHGYLKSLSPAEELAVFLSIRGQCLMESGRDAEAVESFGHAVRLRPGSPDLKLLVANARAKSRGLPEAQPFVSNVATANLNSIPSVSKSGSDISSEFVPDPNPLRKIR